MRRSLTLLAITCFAVLAMAPTAVESYLKIDGVKGDSRAAGHDDWFQLTSFSWGSGKALGAREAATGPACLTGAGGGTLTLTRKGAPSAQLTQLCAQHAQVPSLTVEVAGQRHLLQNVSFANCQSQALGGNTFAETVSLNFAKCATHTGGVNLAGLGVGKIVGPDQKASPALKYEQKGSYIKGEQPNAILIGLMPTPQAASLIGLLFNGDGRATLTRKAGGQQQDAFRQAFQSKQRIPSLTLTLNNGQKWTFTNVTIAAFTGGVKPGTEQVSLNFTKVEGPPTGFQDLSYKE